MIGWLDCAAGASGDMLLGALVDAGVPLATLQEAVDAVGGLEPIRFRAEPVIRAGLAATLVIVEAPASEVGRTWADVRGRLERAALDEEVRGRALDTFARLATAEAHVHRVPADDVHFHEVGALDAIADIVGVCAGLHALGLTGLSAGRITLGAGTVTTAHGRIPVPAPAVLALLSTAGAPVSAGPAPYEMCTPTGAALLATHVDRWQSMPPMTVSRVGSGAGSRDIDGLPNIIRLVLGEPANGRGNESAAVVLEANIDDLDPRVWPAVLSRLFEAGAADAWLSPILMKKGRPAHTLHVLCAESQVAAVRHAVFAETPTIGVRQSPVDKYALDREVRTVDVAGHCVRIKLATLDGRVVNVSLEYDDVAAAAQALGQPVKVVLARATAAAQAVAASE